MSPLLLLIPLAAVLAIILVSVGVRPLRVLAAWLAVLAILGAATLLGSSASPEATATAALSPAHYTLTAASRVEVGSPPARAVLASSTRS